MEKYFTCQVIIDSKKYIKVGRKNKPIALNPGNYTGTYKLIGGEISLDFINTISWPKMVGEHDWLDRPNNFTEWAFAAKVLNRQNVNQLNSLPQIRLLNELNKVHQTRNSITNVLRPLTLGEKPSEDSVEELNTLLHQTSTSRYIDIKTYKWTWKRSESLMDVLAPVIWNAAYVLTDIDHTRLKYCPSCKWLFYDSTRNRSRRWCDMEDCGSRDKSLKYYHRNKLKGY